MEPDSAEEKEEAKITTSSSASCREVVMKQQPKTDHQEHGADFDLDSDAAVIGAAGGEVKVEKTARSQRKVRFNDCSLTQVLEFQPSARDDAVSLCAQLCTWLCGQRSANDYT